jgi:hypothetical protein
MSRNGSGVYSLPAGNPVVTGTTISSSWANTTLSDIATALTGSIAADGQTAMTGNLQMGNNKVTGLAVASATGDALSYNQAATVTTLTTTGNVTIGGTLTLTGGLTLNGNVTVGDASTDTLTVNATSTFAAGATFSSTFAANGGATLGDASGDALTINSSAVSIPNGLNFDSNTFVIDATNNRVGVGTASPAQQLHLTGIQLLENSGEIRFKDAGGTQRTAITLDSSNNFNLGTSANGNLVFYNGSVYTERMRITTAGNVGIGTSSPSSLLTVSGAGSTGLLTINRTDGSGFININSSNGVAGAQIGSTGTQGLQFYTNFSTSPLLAMQILNSGNVGIGITSPSNKLHVYGSDNIARIQTGQSGAANIGMILFYDGAGDFCGQITSNPSTNTTSYNTSSDYRLKDNQTPLTSSGAFIDALQPKTWTWKSDGSVGVGFIAHEVQAVSPNSVVGEKDAVDEEGNPKYQSMEYGSAEFIANIIAELQDLRKRIAVLESK